MTTRGCVEQDMVIVANLISKTLTNINNQNILDEVKAEVAKLTSKYPVYQMQN